MTAAMGAAPWRREEQGALVLTLHVQPGAKRTEVAGVHGAALRIRLAAPPVDGKANAELTRFLANAFGVPRRNVTLVRGDASRQKTVRIEAPGAAAGLHVGGGRDVTTFQWATDAAIECRNRPARRVPRCRRDRRRRH